MDIESIVSNYKMTKFGKRALLLVFLSILPAGWVFFEDGQILQEEKDTAESAKNIAEQKFKKARKRKSNLPKLEEKLAFTVGELAKAKKKLPDEFVMEKILQNTAMIAQDIGLELRVFDPGKGRLTGGDFKYVELPINLVIFGTYGEIASFFDRIVHLELLVHLRNIKMQISNLEEEDDSTGGKKIAADKLQKHNRDNLRLIVNTEMVVFRSPSEREESAIEAVDVKDKKKDKKREKNKSPKKNEKSQKA